MNVLLLALSLFASSVSPDASARPLRRYLLAAASNDGGPGKVRLRFSSDDAQGVVAVMKSLGGVLESSSSLLLEPDTGRFLSSLREMSLRMAQAKDSGFRVEFMLYYSGHSDEDGLLLGASRLRYSQLRKALESSPAEIRLAVLDACASGAALRSKGGVRKQAFRIEGAERLRGQAYLTSSRAEESSQESDKLKGSFFTQAFLSGLRGAADADADGRVTLLEAYRYAYQETVEKTSSTRTGPQHPEFDLDLSGSGDVVLTDLSLAGANLEFPAEISGRIEVTDSAGAVVVDLEKPVSRKLTIGLAAGAWRVVATDSTNKRIGHVVLDPGRHVLFGWTSSDSIMAVGRLSPSPVVVMARILDTAFVDIPVNFGLFPPVSVNRSQAHLARNRFSLDAFVGEAARIDGLQIAGGFARANDFVGTQMAMVALSERTMAGTQFGIASMAGKGGKGFQAGVGSWLGNDFTGCQAAVAAVSTGNVTGVQAGVIGFANGVKGAQLAVLNVSGSVTGTQIGVLNIARSVKGLQAGVFNLAGRAEGAQIGILNLADTLEGAVIGVVNFARDLDGLPLGLVSLGLNMRPGIELSLEETGWGAGSLRLDGNRFHLKFLGLSHVADPAHRFGCGFGWGVHWSPDSQWNIEADVQQRQLLNFAKHDYLRTGHWSVVSISGHRKIGLFHAFAGVSYNVLATELENDANAYANVPGRYQFDAGDQVRMWPGAFVGVGLEI